MFPLNVVLIGCDTDLLPPLRDVLREQGANVEAEYPDVRTVLERLRSVYDWTGVASAEVKKRMFILRLKSTSYLPELRSLAGHFAGQPILVLLEPGAGQTAVIQAMRDGAAQVVLLPFQADDFRSALGCIAQHRGRSEGHSQVIAVSGVTGGSGATTLAINLAYELSALEQGKCLLVELAMKMGVVATYLGIQPLHGTHDVLREGARMGLYIVQKALTAVTDNLSVLAGPHEGIVEGPVSPEDLLRLLDQARRLACRVVVDVPCTYDDLHFKPLAAADHVLLVGEQTVASARAMRLVHETLLREGPRGEIHPVINKYEPRVKGFSAADLQALFRFPRLLTVARDSPAVTASLNGGRPLRQEAPHSAALADIHALARKFASPDPGRSSAAGSGLFRRLFSAITRD